MDERAVSSGMADQPDAKRTRPTYADIEALPEHVVGEIIAGELVVKLVCSQPAMVRPPEMLITWPVT